MKLTTDQIAKIDETLVLNRIIYEDIKLELTDHIASEIEFEMNENKVDFEIAFKGVFEKWKEQLKPKTYGWWLGYNNSGAKIFMDKFLKFTINEYKVGLCLLAIFVILRLLNLGIAFTDEGANATRIVLKTLVCIVFMIIFTGRIVFQKHQFKTTFSEIFKRRFKLSTVYFLGFMFGAFRIMPSFRDEFSDSFSIFTVIIFMYYNFNSFRLVTKHFKTKKQIENCFVN